MDFNLVYVAGIAIVAFVLLMVFRPKDNTLHRNLRPGVTLAILVILAIVLIACVLFFGERIIRNGVGELYTDYAEIVTPAIRETDGDVIRITVNVDKISISNKEYSSIEEIKPIISEGAANGKKVHIVDDYALAETYEDLVSALGEMGLKSEDISEEKVY